MRVNKIFSHKYCNMMENLMVQNCRQLFASQMRESQKGFAAKLQLPVITAPPATYDLIVRQIPLTCSIIAHYYPLPIIIALRIDLSKNKIYKFI